MRKYYTIQVFFFLWVLLTGFSCSADTPEPIPDPPSPKEDSAGRKVSILSASYATFKDFVTFFCSALQREQTDSSIHILNAFASKELMRQLKKTITSRL